MPRIAETIPSTVPARFALIIGNSEYSDTGLSMLRTPSHDTKAFAELLANPEYGGFDEVTSLLNEPSHVLWRTMAEFFTKRRPDDLLVLYFSGHGIRDENLQLYFAAPDTTRDLLDGSAVRAAEVRRLMDASNSRRQVLILDCCHSGAFPTGVKSTKAADLMSTARVGTREIFVAEEGYGRVVLTASDSTEYAWEGDIPHGESERSVFTEHLIQGILTSEADTDFDQRITVDELFNYAYEQILRSGGRQRPQKFGSALQGRLVISKARQRRAPLPQDIEVALRSQSPHFRLAAVSALRDLYQERADSRLSVYIELTGLTCDPETSVRTEATLELTKLARELRDRDFGRMQEIHAMVGRAYHGQQQIEQLLLTLEVSTKPPQTAVTAQPIAPRPEFSARPLASGGGLGFVVNIKGERSHDIILKGIQVLINLRHRAASGHDPETGDGAGILIQIPHAFFARECANLGFVLPPQGEYGIGMVFMPVEPEHRLRIEGLIELIARDEGLIVLGWRDTPVNADAIGRIARASQPYIEQVFIRGGPGMTQNELERKLFVVRKTIEREVAAFDIYDKDLFYIPSLSTRIIIYKGLLHGVQVVDFYSTDLTDPLTSSAIAVLHQSFAPSTPSWNAAQPCRYLCHNGSITTLRANVNWMYSRQSVLASPLFGHDINKLFPVIEHTANDSISFDNAFELLVQGGRSLPHTIAMLIPEAWNGDHAMDPDKRAFYEYHAPMMEPWDGPAAVAFTDGRMIGATLDNNGLRPARYFVTDDDLLIMASQTGVLPVESTDIRYKGRLQPGRMLLVDTEEGRIIPDEEIKQLLASHQPYGAWIEKHQVTLDHFAEPPPTRSFDRETLIPLQRAFGYTDEDLRIVLASMATSGDDPMGSMGIDTPLACLSDKPQSLFNYFKQLFSQVSNPPIDPIREELVMSLTTYIGSARNILDETPLHCHMLKLPHPILTNRDLEKLRRVSHGDLLTCTLPMLFRVEGGAKQLDQAIDTLCRRASLAIQSGYTLLILSDRGVDENEAPIPSLLALSAVHNHLVRENTRTQVALIIESGELREVMHFCLLIGYGASAVNPYLAIETLEDLAARGCLPNNTTFENALKNYKTAINKGLLKVFSKVGISTLQSYRGAQMFEAIGLCKALIDRYFTGTASRIGGVGLEVLAREAKLRHDHANQPLGESDTDLAVGGNYQYRVHGEWHLLNPATVSKIQHAVQLGNFETFQEFSKQVNEQNGALCTLRGLMELRFAPKPIPVVEVEPASEIVRRFATGAMSFGSISREAHETLAIAMNRIGGRSNTGEGGEDEERYPRDPNGDWRRSAIKQVASGRFGVTTTYLVNAEELEIKIAQGSNPGEGGYLPASKVADDIAILRRTIPGVALISPPSHADIYLLEDLAQLIFDLKNVNPRSRISVKLVAQVGVGEIAASVSKAYADAVLISGYDGGTGASPLSSIRHAGIPWELGLAEVQQVLVMRDLRSRICLKTDGKLQTGRDVAIAALLGAEEFSFSTAPLVAMGCIMTRACHLNTCPVGIATQDPTLRAKFIGQPEHVINYFFFIAEEVRQLMAKLAFRTMDEMIGRVDRIEMRSAIKHWKARGLDFSSLLYNPQVPRRVTRRCTVPQDHGLEQALDYELISLAKDALEDGRRVEFKLPIRNEHRTVGAMLSGEIARRHGSDGLPHDTINIQFTGSAGQSFGAFLAKGVTLTLEGDANDYVGKGLSGGKLIVYPPRSSFFLPEENILIGNVVLYGATSGEAYFNGMAGERFAVRNSGAMAVVEGVGDHGCEYMTKGVVVVLGRTGRNFAAGMTGGVAFVLDETGEFSAKLCDRTGVDLEPVTDIADAATLQMLITQHFKATGSPLANFILENWASYLARFIKVFPHELKRALGVSRFTRS